MIGVLPANLDFPWIWCWSGIQTLSCPGLVNSGWGRGPFLSESEPSPPREGDLGHCVELATWMLAFLPLIFIT